MEQDVLWKDAEGNGYARVLLVESGTPAGFDAPESAYRLLMYFDHEEGSTTEVFNDAYYVKGADSDEPLAEEQTGWALYPTKETGEGGYAAIEGLATSQYRIVNWPVDEYAVTVRKYGYEVNEQTLNKTSEELDAHFLSAGGRAPLSVTMKLQRSSGEKWVDYVYPSYESGKPTGQLHHG